MYYPSFADKNIIDTKGNFADRSVLFRYGRVEEVGSK
jgi:hypothetical protein